MQQVMHLIPYDTVGGVETAARTVPATWHSGAGEVQFRRAYLVTHSAVEIFPDDFHGPAISVNHPIAHWKLLRFALHHRPDVLIASLWRSCPALIAYKILRPRTKVVLFLHSAVDVHVFDRVLNRLAMLCAAQVWADSVTTLAARVPRRARQRAKVLSFLTSRPLSFADRPSVDAIAPRFVFWGRLQAEKNIGFALEVFAAIHARVPEATFDIFGPDRGALADLQARVAALGLGDAVQFLGALPQDQLLGRAQDYSFYLQTSLFEGMAMSVIEAMGAQNGPKPHCTAMIFARLAMIFWR